MQGQLLAGLLCLVLCAGIERIKLSPAEIGTFRRFITADGREVQLRGFNAVVKGFPWVPSRNYDPNISLADEDLAAMASLGHNFLRLGVMWPGVETAPGVWNHTYIEEIRSIVTRASSHGIWTLLDMHQDLFNPQTCGEGIVDWAVNFSGWPGFPVPLKMRPFAKDPKTGYISPEDCKRVQPWYFAQGALATQQSFQNLFTGPPLQLWANAWRFIANATKDLDGVLGFELLNEPPVGNVVTHPAQAKTEVAEAQMLQPAYDVVAKAIREVAPDSLIFFQPILVSTGCGFSHPPGGPEFADRSVLAFHYYGYPKPSAMLPNKVKDAIRLRVGLLADEFAMPNSTDPESDPYWTDMSSACDSSAVGWGLWEWKTFCKPDGSFGKCKTGIGEEFYLGRPGHPNVPVLKALTRPYVRRVGGWVQSLKFDAAARRFECVLNVTEGETEVTMSQWWVSQGTSPQVDVEPKGILTFEYQANNSVIVFRPTTVSTHSNKRARERTTIKISL